MEENGSDCDGVDASRATSLAVCGFPDSGVAFLVGPIDLLELNPFGFFGGELIVVRKRQYMMETFYSPD